MKRSGASLALAFIAFAAALAVIIGSRLSEQTMNMLVGAVCGAGLIVPFAIVAGMYIGSQRAARDRQTTQPQPPIVVMTPPQTQPSATPLLPAWSTAAPGGAMPAPRQYTILGEETIIDGTSDVWG
jgi:Mn2+/Fe2+ NRAMP family transporter